MPGIAQGVALADSLPPQNRKQYIAGQLQAWRILRLYCQFTHPPKEKFLLLTLRQHIVPLHPPLPGERERPGGCPRAACKAGRSALTKLIRPGEQGELPRAPFGRRRALGRRAMPRRRATQHESGSGGVMWLENCGRLVAETHWGCSRSWLHILCAIGWAGRVFADCRVS